MIAKISDFVKVHFSDIILALCIALITVISFNIGKIAGREQANSFTAVLSGPNVKTAVTSPVPGAGEQKLPTTQTSKKTGDLRVYVSKASSSKVYHFSWCPGASKIAEKNKLTFENEAAAIAAGYTLAGNCQK